MQKDWLEENPSRDISVFVVWSSQLGAREDHVPGGAGLLPDDRAVHFWDPSQLVGAAYAPILGTGAAAWDVWLLFGRDVTWNEAAPPDPTWWEHQLAGLSRELRLDSKRFAEKGAELLNEDGRR